MKILLMLKSAQFLRPFSGAIRELSSRGHEIRVAWHTESDRSRPMDFDGLAELPGVSFTMVPGDRSEEHFQIALVRRAFNYVRYLGEPYRGATKLRRRAFAKLGREFFRPHRDTPDDWPEIGLALTPRELKRLMLTFAFIEGNIPPDPACLEFVRSEQPDVMLVSPLVDLNSSAQADFAKCAAHLGIPVAMLVYSWDNLSTKGGLHVVPDHLFVWNQRQVREAGLLHRVRKERVTITGAPRFDAFLDCQSQLTREAYLAPLELDPAQAVVTYVCSSAFISGRELAFVRRWVAAVRASADPRVSQANLIVRPHPDIALTAVDEPEWKVSWGLPDGGSLWRPFDDARAVVLSTPSRNPQSLYECLHQSDVVVGLNTSAEIEAGILGKPVLSIEVADDEAADGQQGTLHFRYLLREEGGFVESARDLAAHTAQLAGALAMSEGDRQAVAAAALAFIRPLGHGEPVALALAGAIERWALAAIAGPAPGGAPLA